jgi:S-adenosylmethionine decarboxylase proenzyme
VSFLITLRKVCTLKRYFILLCLSLSFCWQNLHAEQESYEFSGKHFIASFYDCDKEALSNLVHLKQAFMKATESSGATILDHVDYVFEPDGLTMVILLSESHASIHTYPEHGACFIDLFTCGTKCRAEFFEQVLKQYLKPKSMACRYLDRG